MGNKEILYPIFLECSQYIQDMFWINIFEDLAYGVCPFGVTIDDSNISCSFKNKYFSYTFREDDSRTICNTILTLFQTKLNLFSKLDYLHQKDDLSTSMKLKYDSWKCIKKKTIRDILMENFIIHLKHTHHLTFTQARQLLNLFTIGFNFKIISNEDVIYNSEKVKIESINNQNYLDQILSANI